MNIGLDDNINTTNTVELNFYILVVPPVTHSNEILTTGVVFLVTFRQNCVRVQRRAKSTCLVGFNPRIVVN